ncbi:hypothetical protein GLAREA_09750 [Glarea lozoyensis ATCC 20868]|uniref:Uncharacterized protein n=1 Tax=Glarea lozoyensis (strain ATCC 20868 / MF5171) TaxID=1116229 RepID=S3CUE3_GLAL2|nr:uncharacterized protein GLAREA_09750 [Glarea lozoyensis ATCC 20868]EPE28629.1 hypothetical protein GLAREA_09750 [Glarea lozoyensis ATCC 20868]
MSCCRRKVLMGRKMMKPRSRSQVPFFEPKVPVPELGKEYFWSGQEDELNTNRSTASRARRPDVNRTSILNIHFVPCGPAKKTNSTPAPAPLPDSTRNRKCPQPPGTGPCLEHNVPTPAAKQFEASIFRLIVKPRYRPQHRLQQ